MGFGDEILATGMARGAKARGKRIAFGNGKEIIFSPWSEQIFRGNPNIARPGDERAVDIEWIAHHKGHRLYNSLNRERTRWIWNTEFQAQPGEMYFSADELDFADRQGSGFVIIEPNVPSFKSVAPNKQWPAARYEKIARYLAKGGFDVRQFEYEAARSRLTYAAPVRTPSFRHALAALSRAAIYIGPEGGLHHGAAAVGIPAVVLFGGFIPPQVTGYATHTNLTGGASACGSLKRCRHCIAAMDAISVDEVHQVALKYLKGKVAA
jgi:hypothetical protein